MIPYGRQHITQDDIDAVVKVLRSDFLTQGPVVEQLEQRFAAYCGAKYAVAINSCTAGLHLTYMALGLQKGKRLWTSPNTFVATSNAALYCGAEVDFVDIDPVTHNMSVTALEKKLEEAERQGKLPDIVVPVHFSGRSCRMAEISVLADRYGFLVVEDAAHCIGASYGEAKIGRCDYSKAAVFSTHPVKIITTGEGGIVTTNDERLYQKLLRLRTHGITRDQREMSRQAEGAWYFEQVDLGYHYRITDMQCALGVSQMNRLDGYVAKRRDLAARYNDKLKHLPVQLPDAAPDSGSSWHLYVVLLDGDKRFRLSVFNKMREQGIGVNVHYIPVYHHPYYQKLGAGFEALPETESYYGRTLTLPLYPELSYEEQDYICKKLGEIILEMR